MNIMGYIKGNKESGVSQSGATLIDTAQGGVAQSDAPQSDAAQSDAAQGAALAADSIYGICAASLPLVMNQVTEELAAYNAEVKKAHGDGIYEHILARVKSEDSMREKCHRKGLPESPESALIEITDAIGIRIVTRFIDDIYELVEHIRQVPWCQVVREKDYIRHVKPNGYRSYHMIIEVTAPAIDIRGDNPGRFFVEIQLRTLAMDSWASLEHQLKYKQNIANQELIVSELKRCADELNACDLSMQTIRKLIREGYGE